MKKPARDFILHGRFSPETIHSIYLDWSILLIGYELQMPRIPAPINRSCLKICHCQYAEAFLLYCIPVNVELKFYSRDRMISSDVRYSTNAHENY
jgi:hypothetical protein